MAGVNDISKLLDLEGGGRYNVTSTYFPLPLYVVVADVTPWFWILVGDTNMIYISRMLRNISGLCHD